MTKKKLLSGVCVTGTADLKLKHTQAQTEHQRDLRSTVDFHSFISVNLVVSVFEALFGTSILTMLWMKTRQVIEFALTGAGVIKFNKDRGDGLASVSAMIRNLILVQEKKTWEEALEYCRFRYVDLAYLDSKVIPNLSNAQTESVWTGLRFLDGKWFWVSKKNVETNIDLPSCPREPYRCGAHNSQNAQWENRDSFGPCTVCYLLSVITDSIFYQV
ncbi:unnamed protein product [Leuciscus chuanchicus]